MLNNGVSAEASDDMPREFTKQFKRPQQFFIHTKVCFTHFAITVVNIDINYVLLVYIHFCFEHMMYINYAGFLIYALMQVFENPMEGQETVMKVVGRGEGGLMPENFSINHFLGPGNQSSTAPTKDAQHHRETPARISKTARRQSAVTGYSPVALPPVSVPS